MPATFTEQGTIFRPADASKMVDRYLTATEEDIAQQGVNMVRTFLHGVLRHPTGFYESRIATSPVQDSWTVTDSNVIYGPWLEGVGSRNTRSRFKGYAAFRKVTQQLDAKAEQIAETDMPGLLKELNT